MSPFFETLTPKNIVDVLLRHFLFGESLNPALSKQPTIVYDPPRKLTDILLDFSENSELNGGDGRAH